MKLFNKIKNWYWDNIENDKDRAIAKSIFSIVIFVILSIPAISVAGSVTNFVFGKNSVIKGFLMVVYVILMFMVAVYLTELIERKSKQE